MALASLELLIHLYLPPSAKIIGICSLTQLPCGGIFDCFQFGILLVLNLHSASFRIEIYYLFKVTWK